MRRIRSRNGRDTVALSTLPNQANGSPAWKQEVNQRVAAHKDRKTVSAVEPETHSESLHSASTRAAAAAARVLARYANAPSYSEILANDARAAVRAAEAASKAALEAQAAAESATQLARRLGESGALNKLDQARDQVFYADLTAQVGLAGLFTGHRCRPIIFSD